LSYVPLLLAGCPGTRADAAQVLRRLLTEALAEPLLARIGRELEVWGAYEGDLLREGTAAGGWVSKMAGYINTLEHVAELLAEDLLLQPGLVSVAALINTENNNHPHKVANGGAYGEGQGEPLVPLVVVDAAAMVAPVVRRLGKLSRREGTMRLARAFDAQLREVMRPYLDVDGNGERFLVKVTEESAQGLPEIADTRLYPAIQLLQEGLGNVTAKLSSVGGREVWMAVCQGLCAHLFNTVATDRKYTGLGGMRFLADIQALVETISPFTLRPWSHFALLMEASRLMTMDVRKAGKALQALHRHAGYNNQGEEDDEEGEAILEELGLQKIDREQAMVILANRVVD